MHTKTRTKSASKPTPSPTATLSPKPAGRKRPLPPKVTPSPEARSHTATLKRKTAAQHKTAHESAPRKTVAVVQRLTKQATLIERLKQPTGATLADLMTLTGWQAHSIRGVISGILKKKLGLTIDRIMRPDGSKAYHIPAA